MFALLANNWLLATANFQFIALGIFEKEGVVAGTVFSANLRTFHVSAPGVADDLRNFINFLPCLCPECSSRAVRLMIWILCKAEKFRRPVSADGVKRSPDII